MILNALLCTDGAS